MPSLIGSEIIHVVLRGRRKIPAASLDWGGGLFLGGEGLNFYFASRIFSVFREGRETSLALRESPRRSSEGGDKTCYRNA